MAIRSSEAALRDQLIAYLKGGHAHMSFGEMVKDFPLSKINTQAPHSDYTPWRLLEHIRITQWDVLNFVSNPDYVYMKWPDDYWPKPGKKAVAADWLNTITSFKKDLSEFISIIKNPKTDLFEKIPWGEGQTILREALLIIDHSSYHIGEFGILRSVMQTWKK